MNIDSFKLLVITLLFFLTSCKQASDRSIKSEYEVLEIIKDTMITYVIDEFSGLEGEYRQGKINKNTIEKLTEPQKALIAFYSAMGGSNCDGENCDLTTVLGLGKQGSDMHKNIIKKYFPDDRAAQLVIEQDCYQRPSGASSFSDYFNLSIIQKGDTVSIIYSLLYYNRGDSSITEGPDLYVFKNNKFNTISRNLWKEVE